MARRQQYTVAAEAGCPRQHAHSLFFEQKKGLF
jgi:hypothetical protein